MPLMGLLVYFAEACFTGIESGDSSWGLDLWGAEGSPQGDRPPDQRREGPGKKGEPVSSSLDKIHWPKEVHLADVDAAVAEDCVRHRNVEVDVRNRYLKQIILAADDLPGNPRKADFAAFCAFVLCFAYAFGEIDGFPNASAQLFEGLLIVFVLRRRLPRKPGGGGFDIVASALHLVDQGLHVGRKTAAQQHTDVKLLGRCKLFSLAEQDLHILQGLDALRNDLIIHGIFLW